MTSATLTETPDTLVVTLHATEEQATFQLPQSIEEHLLLLGHGAARLTEGSREPQRVDAPAVVLCRPGPIRCHAVRVPLVLYCIYNKTTARPRALQRVRDYAGSFGAADTHRGL